MERKMERLEPIDEDTPIEGYPGFLGFMWDLDLAIVDPEIKIMKDFEWKKYFDALQYLPERILKINLSLGSTEISITEDSNLATILDQIPSIKVTIDVPDNQGPGGGAAHVFFIGDNSDYKSAVNDINALIEVLRTDFRSIACDK
jgi:hypothetical protein